jgi:hypothetical protein
MGNRFLAAPRKILRAAHHSSRHQLLRFLRGAGECPASVHGSPLCRERCGFPPPTYISVLATAMGAALHVAMPAFLFHCPTTGLRVQDWTADDPTEHSDGMYESVTCHACGQVHLLNPKTGKTLGAEPRNE